MSKAYTTAIEAGGREVTVKELTVSEIRNWLKRVEERETAKKSGEGAVDLVGILLFDDIALDDLRVLTDLTESQIGALPPSELSKIILKVKEVNSAFFMLRAKLFGAVKSVLATPAS